MMWTNTGFLPFGMHIHGLFVGTLLIGAIFLIIMAAKFLTKKQLKTWTIWLLIIGVVGTLITCSWGFGGFKGMMGGGFNYPSFASHMMENEDHETFKTPEDFREHMLEEMEEHMGGIE